MLQRRLLLLLSAAILLLTACNSTPDHARLIPKDAMLVAGINTGELGKKIAWNAILGSDLWKEMQKRAPQKTAAGEGLADAGIKAMSTSYVYMLNGNPEQGNKIVGLIPLDDAGKWEAYVKKTFPQVAMAEADGRKEGMLDEGIYAGWNKDLLIVVTATKPAQTNISISGDSLDVEMNDSSMAEDLAGNWLMASPEGAKAALNTAFAVLKETSLIGDKRFKNLEGDGHDITMWVNYDALMSQGMGALAAAGMGGIGNTLWKGSAIATGFDFEQGKITGASKYYVSEALREASKAMVSGDEDKDMISRLPGDNLDMLAAFHFAPKGFKLMLEKAGLLGFVSLGLAQTNLTSDDLFEAFSGDMAVTINGFSMKYTGQTVASADSTSISYNSHQTDMDRLYVIGIGNKEKFSKLLQFAASSGVVQQAGVNGYRIGTGEDAIVMLKDEKFAVFSNKESVATAYLQGKYKGSKMPDDVSKSLTGHPMAMFIDFQKLLQNMQPDASDPQSAAMLAEAKKLMQQFVMKGGEFKSDAFVYDMDMQFKNKEENALLLLLDFSMRMKDAADKATPNMPRADTASAAMVY